MEPSSLGEESAQEWASSQRSYLDSSPSHQQLRVVIDAIEPLLEGQETATTTAQKIGEAYDDDIKNRLGQINFRGLWDILAGAALGYHDIRAKRLADLLIAIHDLPDCTDQFGGVIKMGNSVIWRDLHEWGWLFRDWAIAFDVIYPSLPVKSTTTLAESGSDFLTAQQLLNATTFAAYVVKGLPEGIFSDCGNMQSYASIHLDEALERSPDCKTYHESMWVLLVIPAATWILIAGEKLHQLCHLDPPDSSGDFSTTIKWQKTFRQERWSFWKQRLQELKEPMGIEERYQGLAKKALERMNELDGVDTDTL